MLPFDRRPFTFTALSCNNKGTVDQLAMVLCPLPFFQRFSIFKNVLRWNSVVSWKKRLLENGNRTLMGMTTVENHHFYYFKVTWIFSSKDIGVFFCLIVNLFSNKIEHNLNKSWWNICWVFSMWSWEYHTWCMSLWSTC